MSRLSKEDRLAIATDYAERHDGRYDPAGFLDEACSPQHPAHVWFEWSDTEAARKYRLEQARDFVRDLRITFRRETVERGPMRVKTTAPAFVSPAEDHARGGGYVPLSDGAGDGWEAYRDEARRALDAWLRRYRAAVETAGGTAEPIERIILLLSAQDGAADEAA